MELTIRPVQTRQDLEEFVSFPWTIYQDDPCWVPPLHSERYKRLDLERNPFWQYAERELWLARRGARVVGAIGAIINHHRNRVLARQEGQFGFFECYDDPQVAGALFATAESWLRLRGVKSVIGPYNPGGEDEIGILVDGHHTRPSLLEGHNPPYYPALVESAGYKKSFDVVARLYHRPPGLADLHQLVPEKIIRAAERARRRSDLSVRPIDLHHWPQEIHRAWQIYNTALGTLPGYVPFPEKDFRAFADTFKDLILPDMALIAEVGDQPVGFTLALPDLNQALQKVNGRLDLPGLARLWWYSHRLDRVSFKILMVLPEYHHRGIESVLIYETARAIWQRGYREVDMSLTGDENLPSNRLQENLGFKVYRRYRIYHKDLE